MKSALVARRSLVPCVLALLSFGALPSPAPAQEKAAHPGVTIAFRGLTAGAPTVIGKPRHFASVTVVLANDGAKDADGILRVYRRQEVPANAPPSAVIDAPLQRAGAPVAATPTPIPVVKPAPPDAASKKKH